MDKPSGISFSRIVCGSPLVRTAFLAYRPTHFWWRVILKLHGKPVDNSLSYTEKIRRVADGFTFYAWLYRSLSLIFLLLTVAFIALDQIEKSSVSLYWIIATLLAAIYLWGVSGLGFVGAKLYAQGETKSASYLVAFLVMIIAFLSMALAAISIVAHHSLWLAAAPNLMSATALFAFGVGSYMIEIVYLVSEPLIEHPGSVKTS